MLSNSLKWYRIYEYIRDNNKITKKISNTKKIIIDLMNKDGKTIEYCNKKLNEEKHEVEDAMLGIHYHENMTKREILVNEISQYIYWQTIIAISKKMKYEDFNVEHKIQKIIDSIDIKKIGENKEITIDEIIEHDLDEMKMKTYLKEVIN